MDPACTSEQSPIPSCGLACLPDFAGDLIDPAGGQGFVIFNSLPIGLSIGQAGTPGKEEGKPQQETGKG